MYCLLTGAYVEVQYRNQDFIILLVVIPYCSCILLRRSKK